MSVSDQNKHFYTQLKLYILRPPIADDGTKIKFKFLINQELTQTILKYISRLQKQQC